MNPYGTPWVGSASGRPGCVGGHSRRRELEQAMNSELVFKAMADKTRQRIMQLVARQELSVSELVDCLRQPQSTVSRHLRVLREAGLILDRREATTVMYAAPEMTGVNGDEPQADPGPVRHGRPVNLANGLQTRLLEWISEQEMPKPTARRLEQVLNNRQSRSTEFFSNIGHRWDQLRLEAFGGGFHLEALSALLPSEWVVADIGTGTGYMLPVLAGAFRKVIAVDPVPGMLDAARRRCQGAQISNVVFRQGDLGRLPIQEKHVDLAVSALVLHHVPSPEDALSELFRIVKPGGRLLIIEQRAHQIEAFHELMQDRWWGFEPSKLAVAVTAVGFRQVGHRPLPADAPASVVGESPELFTLTACRVDQTGKLNNRVPRNP